VLPPRWVEAIHRLRADVQRCEEELVVLPVEKRRLVAWTEAMLKATEQRLVCLAKLEPGHPEHATVGGLTIRLTSFRGKVLKMINELGEMQWG